MSKEKKIGFLMTVLSVMWVLQFGISGGKQSIHFDMLSPKSTQPVSSEMEIAPTVRVGFDDPEKQYTNTYVSYNIGPWIRKVGKNPTLPSFLKNAVKANLERAAGE